MVSTSTADVSGPAATPWRDPRRHEWRGGDIACGWVVGAVTLAVLSIVLGVLGGAAGAAIGAVAMMTGLVALSLYGVPVAIGAATLLRVVRWEWLHLLAFAALGALGGALALSATTWTMHDPGTYALPAGCGAITAVVARGVSRRRAIRTRGIRPPEPEDATA
ncbi:hypothetical protein OVA14_12750 [Agrococcus sp. SL85]|uniref:hypothetical protein n=1 Tax=Agrococcus sp. SL85 TaxID=2995141 RepID=UPI00226CD71E|nr:hypothetical protein [Agrococcus sp. SL85]WAC66133.1 hypothetical protein OVA14_12750 [Agrococcus sp. SL85]